MPKAEIGKATWEAIAILNFGSRWQYVTSNHTTDVMTEDNYFHGVNHIFGAGDRIHAVVRHQDGSWSEADFLVVRKTAKSTVVDQISEWVKYSADRFRELVAVLASPGSWNVIDASDNTVVARGLSADEAKSLAGVVIGGSDPAAPEADAPEKRPRGRPRGSSQAA